MLRHCLAPSLRRQLNELPQSLDETYERILKEIHSTNQGNARRLLHCLVVAERPLRVEELAEVLAFDPCATDEETPTFHEEWRWEDQEQVVLSACSSLISVVSNQGSRVVQFSHFSVKEFLTSKRLAAATREVSQYHILLEPAHTILAQACLGVLLRLDNQVNEKSVKNIPLAEYAAEHWTSHAQVKNVTTHLRHAMETLFDSEKPYFLAWLRVYCVDPPRRVKWVEHPRNPERRNSSIFRPHKSRRIPIEFPRVFAEPLYYSSLYGFYNLVEQLVVKDPQHVNSISGNHGSPLLAALWGKHVRVAELLLEHGANINIKGPKNDTPLHKAIGWSDDAGLDAMQFLLKHGADVNARQDDLSTPLHLAASEGRFKAAQLLLVNKANVVSRDRAGKTPLHLVSSAGRSDLRPRLAQLLLEHGADVNGTDEAHATPLHYASEHQRSDIAQILLDNSAQVDAKNNKLQTPLLSIPWRNEDDNPDDSIGLVQLLLENGAEVNAQDENYRTALHLAIQGRQHDIAQMLLDRGAKANVANNLGETPLHLVSRGSRYRSQWEDGYLSALQHLLERGADVNAQDNDHNTPLHLASENGRLEIARALVDHGAKVNAENNRGETPLHRSSTGTSVVDGNCPRVARLLLERGAEINARQKDHATPLHLACRNVCFEVAQVLVDHGADVNAKNVQGQTPFFLLMQVHLSRSIESIDGYLDFIGLLVEHGADANTRGNYNKTALHLASEYGRVGVARVLLNHGANVDAKSNWGWSPSHQVARADNWQGSDRLAVARLLLENNANVNAQDGNHDTPLHFACNHWQGRLDTALVLINHGAIVDAQNKRGRTPLHVLTQVIPSYGWAGFQNIENVARLLLERGANANASDEDNATPLHLACSDCALQLAPVLLDCGANPSAKDNLGRTPLHRLLTNSSLPSEQDYLGFVNLLLRDGVDVNSTTEDGATALHLAFDHHMIKVAKVLSNSGANPNVKNNLGETPLHLLLKNAHFSEDRDIDVVQLLLEHGANPNAQDRAGVAPLHLASRNGRFKVTGLLLNYGARR